MGLPKLSAGTDAPGAVTPTAEGPAAAPVRSRVGWLTKIAEGFGKLSEPAPKPNSSAPA